VHSGAGIYNIERGRASPCAAGNMTGIAVRLVAGGWLAVMVWWCMFIQGLYCQPIWLKDWQSLYVYVNRNPGSVAGQRRTQWEDRVIVVIVFLSIAVMSSNGFGAGRGETHCGRLPGHAAPVSERGTWLHPRPNGPPACSSWAC
jgi:hypothetical protein